MIWPTQYDHPPVADSVSGDRYHTTFTGKYNSSGVLELVETGKEDIYDMIQSHADSVDIHVLLKRYANGEMDVFEKREGQYFDATEMPTTFAEMLNIVNNAKATFDSLPQELRNKFDQSFEVFLAKMDSPEFGDLMGFKKDIDVDGNVSDKMPIEKPVEKEMIGSES